jgi:uncharacterized protein (TIGR02996 family)
MSDRDSFLRAIRANPDDDTLRLVFADWLDEHDDPLGQLIRVQIELEPIREQLDSPRVQQLILREADLLFEQRLRWIGRMINVNDRHPGFGPVFRRGLPEFVCLSLDNLLKHGRALFEDCPTVREVSIYGVAGRGAELAACPHLANVETLEIADWLGQNDQVTLGEAELIRNVSRFRVWVSEEVAFIRALVERVEPEWPERITLVHLHPTIHTRPILYDFGITPEMLVGDINHATGRDGLAELVEPFAAHFPLLGGIGCELFAGRLADGTPALAHIALDTVSLVTFPNNGAEANRLTETCLAPEWTLDSLYERFGFTTGLIHICGSRGQIDQFVHRWPETYVTDYIDNRFERPPGWTDKAWNNRGGVLRRWLHEGLFVIEWGGREFFADSSGTIVSG